MLDKFIGEILLLFELLRDIVIAVGRCEMYKRRDL
jgi:hypothetical protein